MSLALRSCRLLCRLVSGISPIIAQADIYANIEIADAMNIGKGNIGFASEADHVLPYRLFGVFDDRIILSCSL